MSYCSWGDSSPTNWKYHHSEWGVPLHDDRMQFEFLMLEVLQCGLNWNMMMQKREIFRSCFNGFDYDLVAGYGEDDIQRILNAEGMIRSRRKIEAIINNARCFNNIRSEFGSFSAYLWSYSKGRTILYDRHADGWIPASNGLSERIAKDLRRRGFKFLGAVTVYSHLQACGIVNDHSKSCPCFSRINEANPTVRMRADTESGVQYYGDD